MNLRKEQLTIPGLPKGLRLLHLSDVHFSRKTGHEKNAHITQEILRLCAGGADVICITGDLVSRKWGAETLPDALTLAGELRRIAPVAYALGNHEMDLPEEIRADFLRHMEQNGITVLHNETKMLAGVRFTDLTLPQAVFKHPDGSYRRLQPITPALVRSCIGEEIPQILLAHSPIGFDAYAALGTPLTLSGHVHGGIVRIGNIGLLSPERRFLPKFTKGVYIVENSTMQVSAGIGKLRINNPSEVIEIILT